MNVIELIPSIDRELLTIKNFLDSISDGRFNIGLDTKTNYEQKSEALKKFLNQARNIILNGIHFDIGNFLERGYVHSPDYNVASTLLNISIDMPYPEFSISMNIDAGGKKIPMVFIVTTVQVSNVSYFVILPLFILKENKNISHTVFPPIIPIGTFQHNLKLDSNNSSSKVFFGNNDIPSKLKEIFKQELSLQVIQSKNKECISTYGFSYIFFDESSNDQNLKINGRNFMNFFMQEYFMKFLFLLNTKGVTTEKVKPSPKLNKKRAIRNKLPIREHRVLKFQLPKNKKLHRNNRGDGIMPFHSVMGHTKTYTRDNPLFGKYVGPVWCPSHFKGDEEVGSISKDYKLIPKRPKSEL